MQETGVLTLEWKDPLEEGTATHCSILAWKIPWIEEPGGLQSMESQESDTTERLHSLHLIRKPKNIVYSSLYQVDM